MKSIIEKPHRLSPECYRGCVSAAYTLCAEHRRPLFTNSAIQSVAQRLLFDGAKRSHCDIPIFLFMPDHCHIILQGNTETADTYETILRFKQQSGFWFSRNYGGRCWQKNFYDHILRTEDDVRKHILYVLHNPVRKELVSDWKGYPYKGSTVYNFDDW